MTHEFHHAFRIARRQAQPPADVIGHGCAYFHVVIETDAFRTHVPDARREFNDRRDGVLVDCEIEPRGKADRAQHAQTILAEAPDGITNRANATRLDIRASLYIVDDLARRRLRRGIIEQAVDCEIAPQHIFFWRLRIANFIRMAAIGVDSIAAKSRHLHVSALTGY